MSRGHSRMRAELWLPWLAVLLKIALVGALLTSELRADEVIEVQLMPVAPAGPAASSGEEAQAEQPDEAVAIFGGGCFWCMEKPFDQMDGVLSTTSGYTGGALDNPTYEQVSSGRSGHVEVVEVRYDPRRVSYAQLLNTFWRNVDPLAVNRQFCDAGPQYRSAIFVLDDAQRAVAEASRAELARRFGTELATEILPAQTFWAAEDYHQDYYLRNPIRYGYYRSRCGRDARLEQLWGPP
ncbi:MAG: peptide-methionine (S)-S-oxide reductase MsrA [Aquimonas sp.]|nr:peptide-methionine (S)-S-oxide reductase MsrA [Aquimonas sp.]